MHRGTDVGLLPLFCLCQASQIKSQFSTSISDDSEMTILTKSECCFCLFSVAKKVTNTPPVNRSSTQQNLGKATGSTLHRQETHDGDKSTRRVGQDVAFFPHYAEIPTNKSRTSQRARILHLQIEIEQLKFLAEFTKRARCEITMRTTPTDDV